MGKFIDLTGRKFGKLTVIKRTEDYVTPKGHHSVQWICKCDCGNEVIVSSGRLTAKNGTKSCGCFQKETVKLIGFKNKKYNTYDLSGESGIGYTLKGEPFYFDLEDYDKIKNYCWRIDCNGYVITKKEGIRLHKLLLDDAETIDHINHKRHDNRKCNLRKATYSQNGMNRSITKRNTSGVKGVSWYKSRNKWIAYISFNKRFINLGYFDNFNDAVKTRKEAEEKYFGEWSYDNSMKEDV